MFLPRTPLNFSKIRNLNFVSSIKFVLQSHRYFCFVMKFLDQEVKISLVSKESKGENCRENDFSLKTFSQLKFLHNFYHSWYGKSTTDSTLLCRTIGEIQDTMGWNVLKMIVHILSSYIFVVTLTYFLFFIPRYSQHDSSTSLENTKLDLNIRCVSQGHRVIPVEPSIYTTELTLGCLM